MTVEVKDGVIAGNVHPGDVHNTNVTNIHQQSGHNREVRLKWGGIMVTRNQYFLMFYISLTIITPALLIWVWFSWEPNHPANGTLAEWLMIGGAFGFVVSMIAWCFEANTMDKKFTEAEEKTNTDSVNPHKD